MDLQRSYKVYSRYYRKIGPVFKKPRVKAYTMLILSFFTMSFFGFFAIKPTLTTIFQLRKKIADSQSVNRTLEQKIIHLFQLKEEYEKLEKDLPLITAALPAEPQVYSLLKNLEDLAQATGATISGVRVNNVNLADNQSPSSNKLSCSVILEGSYSACRQFLDRLLNTSRIYKTDRFEMRSGSKREASVLKLDLNLEAYFL